MNLAGSSRRTGGKTVINNSRHQRSSRITRVSEASPLLRSLVLLGGCLLLLFADVTDASAKIAANKLASNRIASNKIAANRLAVDSLSADGITIDQLAANDLLTTEDGRQVLEYLLSCALPEEVTLVADFDGVHYEFPGGIGLAPRWIHRPLTPRERRWISACMIARVNLYASPVAISLRGPHPALTVDQAEGAFYTVEEAAFYGDIFDDPIVWVAARGEGQALGEFGQLDDRDCAEEDFGTPGLTMCGFTYAGDAADFTPAAPSPYACEIREAPDPDDDDTDSDLFFDYLQYGKCFDQAGAVECSAKRYKEVITVYVHP